MVPRVLISNNGGMEGEFQVDVDEQTPYVAISHVCKYIPT